VAEVRKIARGRALIMSKIESPGRGRRLEEIIEASDALMWRAATFGVELAAEKVPGLQKRIIRAPARCKPVVVATQMRNR